MTNLSSPVRYLISDCPDVERFPVFALGAYSGNLIAKFNALQRSLSLDYKVEPMLTREGAYFIPSSFRLMIKANVSNSVELIDLKKFKEKCNRIFERYVALDYADFKFEAVPTNVVGKVTSVVVRPNFYSVAVSCLKHSPCR